MEMNLLRSREGRGFVLLPMVRNLEEFRAAEPQLRLVAGGDADHEVLPDLSNPTFE
jgi:hypothetical protein